MSRQARLVVPGITLHVFNRGHNRMVIYRDESDYRVFLALLRTAAQDAEFDVHAFALMQTHYHLMATPGDGRALTRNMKRVGQRYARYFNRKYGRSGALWTGRYC